MYFKYTSVVYMIKFSDRLQIRPENSHKLFLIRSFLRRLFLCRRKLFSYLCFYSSHKIGIFFKIVLCIFPALTYLISII